MATVEATTSWRPCRRCRSDVGARRAPDILLLGVAVGMLHFVGKCVGWVSTPSNFCMLLALAGAILLATRYRTAGVRLLVTSILALLVFGTPPLSLALTIPLENRIPQWHDGGAPPTGVIVLGGVINPAISFARHQVALSEAAERLTETVALARRFPQSRIVFTGWKEAPFADQLMQALGVAASRITLESDSRDTYENAVFTKRLVDPKPGERWLLVTSAMHMPRAVGAFRKARFAVEPVPVDYVSPDWPGIWFWPKSLLGGVDLSDHAVHEWLGLLGYWLTGRSSALFPAPPPAGAGGRDR